mmetsp:Transcript_7147/g.17945  ORF Transcript_7147/g.17945 Transcript_7147/m.17945 type:complete len:516 (-) Transcript_7147:155-1702(-)
MTFSSVRTALQHNGRKCFHYQYRPTTIPRRVNGSLRRSLSTTTDESAEGSKQEAQTQKQKQKQNQRVLPTRHSSRAPPPVCKDATELRELTQELLETPIGSLYCQDNNVSMSMSASPSPREDRDAAYALARESGELVEYLLRGYNATVSPLSLHGGASPGASTAVSIDPEELSASLESMMDVMERFHHEGEMYLQLRKEALDYQTGAASPSDSSSSSSSSSDSSDSDSSDSDSDSDSDRDDDDNKDNDVDARLVGSGIADFATPGVTTAMYDTILDAMACASQVALEAGPAAEQSSNSYLQLLEPDDLYRVAGAAWKAHDLNNQHNDNNNNLFFAPTTPTMVTYNAALRGIGNLCLAARDDPRSRAMIIDQGLAYGFGVYNHLTHNDHGLPKRNSASIVYLLRVIEACIPPSRTRGNMTVALWHQASMEGLVTPELIRAIEGLHSGEGESGSNQNINGPEFDVFLASIDKCKAPQQQQQQNTNENENDNNNDNKVVITPQRFARFAKKHGHSKHY